MQHICDAASKNAHGVITIENDRTTAARTSLFGDTCDFRRLVTNALQIGNHLSCRHHCAQVVRGGLAFHNQMTAHVIQRDL